MVFINDRQWHGFNYARENKTMDDNSKSWTAIFLNVNNFMG
jgi:hypothetical protein